MNQHSVMSIKESALQTSLNELAHTFVRELAMACRKMAVYGATHPQSIKAIEKPFFALAEIFRFKTALTLNVDQGRLFVANIRLRDSVFNDQILQYLQVLDARAILFERRMTIEELAVFIEHLVRRDIAYDSSSQIGELLRRRNIESIEVNSERAFELFEKRRQYRGEVDADFSVRHLVIEQLGTELSGIASLAGADVDTLLSMGVDFDPGVVRYLLPECLATMPADLIRGYLEDLAAAIRKQRDSTADADDSRQAISRYMAIFKLLEVHPHREQIVANLDESGFVQESDGIDPNSATGQIKIESTRQADSALERFLTDDSRSSDTSEFADGFMRLLKTGQKAKGVEIVRQLLELMGNTDAGRRQRALSLLLAALDQLRYDADRTVAQETVEAVVKHLTAGLETFEYSELLWRLFDSCHREGHLDLMARLTTAMAMRRKVVDRVTIYDSIAVKKAFESVSSPNKIDELIGDLIRANHQEAGYLKDILTNIGTETVALALSRIISHPVRAIRQVTLRILGGMGNAALTVFSGILHDDELFMREQGRHELPNEQWYVIRNSIFVLGSLHDPLGIDPLRVRMSDTDVRVRREIVSALEKIGGEDAVDCLSVMADDAVAEIRQAAIIAIGLVGRADDAPVLIDIARRHAGDSPKAVAALGKLGGDDARVFLCSLLTDPKKLSELCNGRVSKDDQRLAVVRALGHIADRESLATLKEYKASQSAASKLLFSRSPVNKAIDEVLARH